MILGRFLVFGYLNLYRPIRASGIIGFLIGNNDVPLKGNYRVPLEGSGGVTWGRFLAVGMIR